MLGTSWSFHTDTGLWTQWPNPVPYFLTQTSFVPKQLTSSTSSSSSSWSLLFPNICFSDWLALLALDYFCFIAPVYIMYYIMSTEQWIGTVHLLNRYFWLHLGTLVLLLQMEAVNKKNLSFGIPWVHSDRTCYLRCVKCQLLAQTVTSDFSCNSVTSTFEWSHLLLYLSD